MGKLEISNSAKKEISFMLKSSSIWPVPSLHKESIFPRVPKFQEMSDIVVTNHTAGWTATAFELLCGLRFLINKKCRAPAGWWKVSFWNQTVLFRESGTEIFFSYHESVLTITVDTVHRNLENYAQPNRGQQLQSAGATAELGKRSDRQCTSQWRLHKVGLG